MDEQNELISSALEIILNAGDARLEIDKALNEAQIFNFKESQKYIEKAEEFLKKSSSVTNKRCAK